MRRFLLTIAALSLLGGNSARLTAQTPAAKPPTPVSSRVDETLSLWNDIGGKLVAMAEDFPEAKYDYKLQKDQRTFAENLLHVAAVDYLLINAVSGTKMGPDFGKDPENPSREVYKTKADVVALIKKAVADGAATIKAQGDAGLDKTAKFAFGNRIVRNEYSWQEAVEHSGEHYGQLVVYYRANGLVPPASR